FALPPARASSGAELGRRVALIFFELPIDKFSGEGGFAVRPLARASNRSEERRVGKECGCRWGPEPADENSENEREAVSGLVRGRWEGAWWGWFFVFEGEDGIRDWSVTGVQTCALPISSRCRRLAPHPVRNSAEGLP